ncbi:MAG: IS66 family insertion sequence element accessory protein TnpA [Flavobacteriales bacterium]
MKTNDYWLEHFSRCSKDGLSKKAYCQKHKISYSLFYYHQRRLRILTQRNGFQEVLIENPTKEGKRVNLDLRLEFPGGQVLVFPEQLLERVITLIKS